MVGKRNTLLLTVFFIFLIAASAYGQCHLGAVHSDSETGHEEKLQNCPNAFLSFSTKVISQGRSSGNLVSIDSVAAIDTNGQVYLFSALRKYKLPPETYAFRDLNLWTMVLRF